MKEGNTYTAWYSADGETYTELGTKTIELQNIKLILTANNGTGNAGEVKADFKYFKLLETETPVAGVSLDHSKLTLKTGGSEKLTATVAPDNATNKVVTWTTSNAAVAEVDSEGKVTAKAAGMATITVTTEDGGYTAVCEVTVERVSSGSSGGGSSAASYTITVKQGAGGTISPATSTVNKDASKTFTIKANEGYVIADVLVDGKSVGAVSTYTFDKVGANHTITVVFEKAKSGLPFTDVTGHWAKDAIEYAYENKLFAGTSDTTFGPNVAMNRAMLVTVLYRMENEPAMDAENPFADVAADTWYTKAVIWASKNNIVAGYGDGKFGPTDTITREQMASILNRYAKFKGYDVTATTDLAAFTDANTVSGWALESVKWANAEKLINGRTSTTLVPKGNATRAEVAQILMTFAQNAAK